MSTVNEVSKLNDQVIDAWNKHDVPKFLELCDENIVWRDLGNSQPYKGKNGAKDFFSSWLTGFPDLKIKIVNKVITEDNFAVEVEFTGTNTGPLRVGPDMPEIAATRKQVSNKGTYFGKVKNGKFIEVRTYPDLAGMLMQLGLLQEPAGSHV